MTKMKLEKLEYEVIDNVGFITLDYMKNFNAIDVEMATEIITAIKALDEDPEAKVIVIRGQERAFSAGGDIGFFYKKFQEETAGHLPHGLLHPHPVFRQAPALLPVLFLLR